MDLKKLGVRMRIASTAQPEDRRRAIAKLDNRRPVVLIAANSETCFTPMIDATSLFEILVRYILLPLDTLCKRIFYSAIF